MPPIKPLSRKELIYYLRKYGFEGPYSGGKHQFMLNGDSTLRIPNPHDVDIDRVFLIKILKQAGIEKSEWEKL
ncbi:MAG TPA: type II toxin-antitoxin system HicA family toxin [Candidatus Kapabacteria bacterium]|nr:type II toxin-antitoxin system HicA family toxin [Candidatus Kapabacteria bacterium]HPO61449.1 type II toxin-antitoxin system HicA family toxin [Candidatus Kapabacteria bacterium]